jgi:hypothetical protein
VQSRGKMKKVQDYHIGEHVRDCGHDAGKVAAIAPHPSKRLVSYLLLINAHNEYTIYKGLTDCKASLTLARNIPESVAMQFADVIQGGEPLPVPERNDKKYPVVAKSPEPVKTPVVEIISTPEETKAPYFDFV